MDAEELLQRYAAGERRFIEIDLSGIDLSGANLPKIDLCRCNLRNY
ncbi:MAG: pentapeptide repeat-containing protein [Nostoc sp.]